MPKGKAESKIYRVKNSETGDSYLVKCRGKSKAYKYATSDLTQHITVDAARNKDLADALQAGEKVIEV